MTSSAAPEHGNALDRLVAALRLEKIEENLFRGPRASIGWQRVFGGQVLGQALSAACQTVDPARPVHSLHGYFLLAGDPGHDIIYDVERIRDGGSFTTRRVKAIQHGQPIFTMSASFHRREDGFEHQAPMPEVPGAETLPTVAQLMALSGAEIPASMRNFWQRENPIDMRVTDPSRYTGNGPRAPAQAVWLRANGTLPADPVVHAALLAYASDFTLLDTALIPHGKVLFDPDLQLASLDHAMWFHRPFAADEWVLYVQDSPSGCGARGFCRGLLFAQDGRLIASTVQEGLMRKRAAPRRA